ncbi:MAG TPA: isochorismatase family cysteine hydrolase [Chloroflexota bacterium]|nr:isochorismatase family cysteine hydrolase [Chloroflexota bacterium]
MSVEIAAGKTALLIYDMTETLVQPGPSFEQWVVDGMPDLARLLDRCRQTGVLVCYAIAAAGYAGFEICRAIAPRPDEIVVKHGSSGAFTDTDLAELLRQQQRETALISGIAVDRGCNMTARQALALGFQTVMVRGACYTQNIDESPVGPVSKADVERVHLASLHRMGTSIVEIGELLSKARWMP